MATLQTDPQTDPRYQKLLAAMQASVVPSPTVRGGGALNVQIPNADKYGLIVSGRGYEGIPRDPNYPNEVPQQTIRRLEQSAINRDPQGDLLQRAAAIRDEFGDPSAAQFPVSAATKTPLSNSGYGAGYNKGPLDPGYQPPQQPLTLRSLPSQGEMPGTTHLNPAIAPKVPAGSPRPLAPGEWVDNPNGSWSSEISSTIQNADGSWSVVPGMWLVNGKPQRVSEDTAAQYAKTSGLNFPKHKTLAEAEKFANDRESVWQGVKPTEASKIPALWGSQAQGVDQQNIMPNSQTDPRYQKIIDAMRAGLIPPSNDVPATQIDVRQPSPQSTSSNPPQPIPINLDSGLPSPSLADPDYSGSETRTPHPRIGISETGLTGVDKAITDLAVRREANRDYPSSKVVNGEILPPHMHHGLGDRLKAIGKGIIINMGQRAAAGDESTAGLLGAGAAGGVVGGVSPTAIDAQIGRGQLAQREGDLSNQIALQRGAQSITDAQEVPVTLADGTTVNVKRSEVPKLLNQQQSVRQAGRRVQQADDRLAETKRHNDAYVAHLAALPKEKQAEAARKIWLSGVADDNDELKADLADRMGIKETLPNSDKGKVELNDKGQWTVVHARTGLGPDGKPVTSYEPVREANKENRANIVAGGVDTRQNRTRQAQAGRLAGQVKAAQNVIAGLEKQRDAAADELKPYYVEQIAKQQGKIDSAQTELGAYADVYDENGPRQLAAPARRSAAATSRPSPSTHVLNHKAWSGSHDESEWPAAKARATVLGYKIVE